MLQKADEFLLALDGAASQRNPNHGRPMTPDDQAPQGTMMKRYVAILAILLCMTGSSSLTDEPRVVELWPDKPPEEPGTIGEEKTFPSKPNKQRSETTEVTRLITNVTRPTITVYRPAKEKDTGAAMLICPGGGYHNLWCQLEGEEVAAWLKSIGVTGILLKYRVPRRPDDLKGEFPARRPLQDAQRAVSVVRSKAKEWGIDPKRIGIVGFSAGGHLAIATATSFDNRSYEPVDDIDKVSCRPDFAVPVYSGYLKSET